MTDTPANASANAPPPLLPHNASGLERALDTTWAARALPFASDNLWDSAACPAHLLPHLAWAVAVDLWDNTWSDATKRTAITNAIAVHHRTGTMAAMRRALDAAGFPDTRIYDVANRPRHDGGHDGGHDPSSGYTHDGALEHIHHLPTFTDYVVYHTEPITENTAHTDRIRQVLAPVAPVRAKLLTVA